MKSIFHFIGAVMLLSFLCPQASFAQTNFYYSPEGKAYLDVSTQKILVKFESDVSFTQQQEILKRQDNIAAFKEEMMLPAPKVSIVTLEGVSTTAQVAAIVDALNANDKVVYANAFLAHEDGTLHGIQEKVLVRLRSNKDMLKLNTILGKYDVRIEGKNEFDPLLFHVEVLPNSGMNALELANALHETGEFDFAEPDFLRLMKRMNTNDPGVGNQWSLENDGNNTSAYGGVSGADMKVFDAWSVATGFGVKVAILDEGVDLDHPDLVGNMLGGYDGTGQGSGGNMSGDDAHGTACAGIVASVGNNNLGAAGVAYNSQIVPIRIAYSSGQNWVTTNSWIGNSLNWAWQTAGADILSNSWGGGGSSSTINNAIDGAVNNGRSGLGSPVLFAAGNDNGANSYPATYSPTISVIAMSMCNQRKSSSSCDGETWWGSNYGSGADVAAPGVKIYCTDIAGSAGYSSGDFTGTFNGTSSATPNAAGVMALILAAAPGLTESQARAALEGTCDKVGGYSYGNNGSQPNGTWSNDLGYGRVNAAAALASVSGGPTCFDGVQNGDETGVDCGGSSCDPCPVPCTDNEITLTITFDNYPEETAWTLVNDGGATVASGGTYGNAADGSTLTEELCLPNDCYTFTITDAYGDGICCGYGNGSYSVTGGGNTYASGGSFTSSDATNFCLGGGTTPTCDDGVQNGDETGVDCGGSCTACPTCDDGIQNGNETGVDCGGSCAACPTCFDGVQNGNETGVDCGGSCAACPTCDDGIQNGDETGVDCGGSCSPCNTGGCTTVQVDFEDFEGGWGIWNDGGSDCRRSANDAAYANSGSYCARLRDNTSTSVMTTDNLNLAGFEEVTIDFSYYARSMDNSNEDFWLQASTDGGSSYQTLITYARGTDFNNNERKNASVVITGTFTSTTRFRFRCDASGNSDWVYIDDVNISGCQNGASSSSPVLAQDATMGANEEVIIEKDVVLSELTTFPNPTENILNLTYTTSIDGDASIMVMDVSGRVLVQNQISQLAGKQTNRVDVSRLESGYYIVVVQLGDDRLVQKFIKI